MDSARTYTSVSTDAYLRTRSVTTMSASEFFDSLNRCALNKEDIDETDKSKKSDKEDSDKLSGNAESSLEYLKGKFSEISTGKAAKVSKQEEDLRSAIKFMCLQFLLMLLFSKMSRGEINDMINSKFGSGSSSPDLFSADSLNSVQFKTVTDKTVCEHYEGEFEGTTFSSKGIVKTADGREIDFNIDLTMSRSFEKLTSEIGISESIGVTLMDPLVINLDTYAADVSDQKFYFDLDSDGNLDAISSLSSGSGFLALDLNEDGEINNGSELFGTKSGDGFKDLSAYDKDNNGWIDEADEIFDKLKILCLNDDGSTSLYSLKDKGVGAIYLGNRETEFSVTNQVNKVNAQIRKTGLFLYETGAAGTMQHVDLAVELGA